MGGHPQQTTHDYSKPQFFALTSDPQATTFTCTSPCGSPTNNDLAWDGHPYYTPDGVNGQEACAPATPAASAGGDAHLAIISPDRTKSWEWFGADNCSSTGISAHAFAQFNLNGFGYSSSPGTNSARGSGTPIVSTALRSEEAYYGFHHALGCTIPSADTAPDTYLYPPATHLDPPDPLPNPVGDTHYGSLWVLRADFPEDNEPNGGPAWSVGEKNIIKALKVYGCFVVDKGSPFEIDTSPGPNGYLWGSSYADVKTTSFADPGHALLPSDMRRVDWSAQTSYAP
jgi:hypothetical protein